MMEFFNANTSIECLIKIGQKCDVKTQIAEYDEIYNEAFNNGFVKTTDIIPRLNTRIQFIIYCQYSKYILFGRFI